MIHAMLAARTLVPEYSEITNQARQKELETMQQNIQQYQQTVSQELQKKSVDELVELFKEEAYY